MRGEEKGSKEKVGRGISNIMLMELLRENQVQLVLKVSLHDHLGNMVMFFSDLIGIKDSYEANSLP